MIVTAAGDLLLDDGEVSEISVFVRALLCCPTENVECEIGIGLGL